MSTLPHAAQVALASVFLLATSVWVGGSAVVVLVGRAASRTLIPADRVELFRALGRGYGVVGGVGLALAVGTGAVLVSDRPWDGVLLATAAVATALVVVTAVGVVQARRMTRLRRAVLHHPGDGEVAGAVRRGARTAAALRTTIAALTLVLVVMVALLAT